MAVQTAKLDGYTEWNSVIARRASLGTVTYYDELLWLHSLTPAAVRLMVVITGRPSTHPHPHVCSCQSVSIIAEPSIQDRKKQNRIDSNPSGWHDDVDGLTGRVAIKTTHYQWLLPDRTLCITHNKKLFITTLRSFKNTSFAFNLCKLMTDRPQYPSDLISFISLHRVLYSTHTDHGWQDTRELTKK